MTVAPELPPAPAARRREVDLTAVPPPRAGRRGSVRHPAGSVARRTAAPAGGAARDGGTALDSPTSAVRPGLRWVGGGRAEDLTAGPGVTGWWAEPAAVPAAPLAPPVSPSRSGPHTPVAPPHSAGVRLVRPARPGLRLTRRGRVVAGLLVLLAVTAAVLLAVGRAQSVGLDPAPVPASAPAEVVVAPGETLWSIAARVAPGGDPRAVVDRLRALNHLPSGTVHPGQRLRLRTP
ncbi:MAG TPA: LysM peptidoglycan-binding domain-containing protein [Mycobacteriales bacterium]|jgi:LysM repeat protein|nr:LysM peptidoglycan-binding domain-containing protein [Mycobacteriales bacterium]